MTKFKNISKKILRILGIAVIVVEMILIVVLVGTKLSGKVPSFFGYSAYVIVSPSMSPDLEIGDIIISKEYDGGDLSEGQVVEYVGKKGSMAGKIITHRIESISGEGDDRVIVTKGTANPDPDPAISPDDIVAVMVYKTVVIDKIYAVFSTTAGFICLILLPMMAMIITEIVRLLLDCKGENNGETDKQDGSET